MNDLVKYSERTFEDIKHTNEYGEEFWYARELQLTLEYSEWRNFNNAIEKAKTACEASGFDVHDHFVEPPPCCALWEKWGCFSGGRRRIMPQNHCRAGEYCQFTSGLL